MKVPRRWWPLAGLLLTAVVYHGWNAVTLPASIGYDTRGHRKYIESIAREGRLPAPLEGWSTFHPPLYHLVGSLVWKGLSGYGEPAALLGLKAIGLLSLLITGAVCFGVLQRLGASLPVSLVATALVLYVPCSSIAATMIGNEALGALLASLALGALISLQADPRDLRAALLAGLMSGLALATKYSGAFVAGACAVPFLRADFDRRMLRALLLCALTGVTVCGPVYVRNVRLTGSLVPMTRVREAVQRSERFYTLRERRWSDYLWFDPEVFLRPSLFHVKGRAPSRTNRNPAMTNVWGLAYAGLWYDPFAHRIPRSFHRDGVYAGVVTTLLGVVPTAMVVLGFLAGLRELFRRRSATPDAPLIAMSVLALAGFVGFTWRAPSAVAVKGSYLLPLLVPAAVFYARALSLLGRRIRAVVLAASIAAALAAASVFAHGLVFPRLRG